MPAPGGPTTQSGIGLQNAVAALFLGRLLDETARPAAELVCEVRVATRGPVDDIEVARGDGSRQWMQVKERVAIGSEEWRALWTAFREKSQSMDAARGDRLVLWLGYATAQQSALKEVTKRARFALTAAEWASELSKGQFAAVDNVGRAEWEC